MLFFRLEAVNTGLNRFLLETLIEKNTARLFLIAGQLVLTFLHNVGRLNEKKGWEKKSNFMLKIKLALTRSLLPVQL